MEIKSGEIRQSALPLRVDSAQLSVDVKGMYGGNFQVITWSHNTRADQCDDAKRSWFGDPA